MSEIAVPKSYEGIAIMSDDGVKLLVEILFHNQSDKKMVDFYMRQLKQEGHNPLLFAHAFHHPDSDAYTCNACWAAVQEIVLEAQAKAQAQKKAQEATNGSDRGNPPPFDPTAKRPQLVGQGGERPLLPTGSSSQEGGEKASS